MKMKTVSLQLNLTQHCSTLRPSRRKFYIFVPAEGANRQVSSSGHLANIALLVLLAIVFGK